MFPFYLRCRPELLWLAAIIGAAAALRLVLVLSHPNYLGIDGGAYLLSRNHVLGDFVPSNWFMRPPLAPGWLLVPFTSALGDDIGYKVWAVVLSLPPIPAAYHLGRRFLSPSRAVVASAFVAVDLWLSEILVTGVLPLLPMALILVMVASAMDLTSGRPRPLRSAVAMVICIGVTPGINQTAAGLMAIAVVITMAVALARRDSAGLWVIAPSLAGGVFACGWLPWYGDVLPGSEKLSYPGPIVAWGLNAPGILQTAIALPLGILALRRGPVLPGLLLMLCGVLICFASYDETLMNVFYRPRYLLQLLLWPLVVWAVARLELRPRVLMQAFVSVLIGVLAVGTVYIFGAQARYSDMVTADTAAAVRYLNDQADSEAVIGNAWLMTYWLAALTGRESPPMYVAEPPPRYAKTYEHVRCIVGWIPDCDPEESSRSLDVGYVLVDHRLPFYNDIAPPNWGAPPDQWGVTASAPWLELVFEQGRTKLWAVQP